VTNHCSPRTSQLLRLPEELQVAGCMVLPKNYEFYACFITEISFLQRS
jgi:hypothetical protein